MLVFLSVAAGSAVANKCVVFVLFVLFPLVSAPARKADAEAETEAETEQEGDCDCDCDADIDTRLETAKAEADAAMGADAEKEAEADGDGDRDRNLDFVAVLVTDPEADPEVEAETEAEAVCDTDSACDALRDDDTVDERVTEGVVDGVGVALCEDESDCVCDAVCVEDVVCNTNVHPFVLAFAFPFPMSISVLQLSSLPSSRTKLTPSVFAPHTSVPVAQGTMDSALQVESWVVSAVKKQNRVNKRIFCVLCFCFRVDSTTREQKAKLICKRP